MSFEQVRLIDRMDSSLEKLQEAIKNYGDTCALMERSPGLKPDFIDSINIEITPRQIKRKLKSKYKLIKPPALAKKF